MIKSDSSDFSLFLPIYSSLPCCIISL